MIILFRKANGFLEHTTLYEWKPEDSKSGKWYRIRRESINVIDPASPERNDLVRQLFNATLTGLVCRVHAKYQRKTKILELEVMKQ